MLSSRLNCPKCGAENLDVHRYESMIVVSPLSALFTVGCPMCATRVSGLLSIPDDMQDEVCYAAIEVGAGMGRGR